MDQRYTFDTWDEAFLETWALITTTYPDDARAGDNSRACDIYCELLADVPPAVLRGAVLEVLARSRFFPTPAEIREAAGVLTGPGPAVSLQAYGAAMRELSRAKAGNRLPRIDDPIAAQVVADLGGGHYLLSSDDQMANRAHFLKAYEALAARKRREAEITPQARAALSSQNSAGALDGLTANQRALSSPVAGLRIETDGDRAGREELVRVRQEEFRQNYREFIAPLVPEREGPGARPGFRPLRSLAPASLEDLAADRETCPECGLEYFNASRRGCPGCAVREAAEAERERAEPGEVA